MNYQRDENKTDLNIKNDNIDICINSLLMLQHIDDFENYIVYIDEVNSFLECITHNQILDNNIKLIYHLLVKIIKNCKKIIVSDALISDAVFELLKYRDNDKKIFIINEYQKYKNIKAIRVKDEEKFLNKIMNKL